MFILGRFLVVRRQRVAFDGADHSQAVDGMAAARGGQDALCLDQIMFQAQFGGALLRGQRAVLLLRFLFLFQCVPSPFLPAVRQTQYARRRADYFALPRFLCDIWAAFGRHFAGCRDRVIKN